MRVAVQAAGYRVEERREPGSAASEDTEAIARRAEIRDLSRRVVVGALLTAPVLLSVMATQFSTRPGSRFLLIRGCSSRSSRPSCSTRDGRSTAPAGSSSATAAPT